MNKTEQALRAARDLRELVDLTTHQYEVVNEAAYILEALLQSEAPVKQPEDERERFEAFCARNAEETHHKHPDGFAIWQAAKRDALAQAPQERAAVTDAEIQELWGKTCMEDSPSKPGWARHLRFARALLSLAQSSEGEKP